MSDDVTLSGSEDGAKIALRILSTTDVHGHLLSYDYYTDRPNLAVGLSRVASVIAARRGEVSASLLFDSGDFLQGSLMADDAMTRDDPAGNPVMAAMNLLAYDAGTLGNHEFNFGIEALRAALEQARFPIVSSNLGDHGLPCPPGVILRRRFTDSTGQDHMLGVGLIGLVPPQIQAWDRTHVLGRLTVEDMIPAAERETARLRNLGADLVVALCHSGLGHSGGENNAENAALQVAGLPGIDLVLAGHTHDRVLREADTSRAPVLMAGYWGSHLGVADLTLTKGPSGWRVAQSTLALDPIADAKITDWAPLVDTVAEAHERTLVHARAAVGRSEVPLHTYFAQLGSCAALELVGEAQTAEVRSHLDEAMSALPLVSAVAPFKAGGRAGAGHYTDIPPGPLKLRDIGNLYLYPNALCAVVVSGADIHAWLARAAGQFQQIPEGATDHPLLDPDFASHDFDILFGLTYRIDLAQSGQARIAEVRYQGRPIAASDRLVVATNSYRIGGGGGFPTIDRAQVLHHSDKMTHEIVRDHVSRGPVNLFEPAQVFDFRPMPNTRVIYETGPGAMAHVKEARRLGIIDPRPRPRGFVGYDLAL